MTNKEYVLKYADAFIQSTIGTNLFPSVMLAQALLEGKAGMSVLAQKHHNHFGIKAGSTWKGAVFYVSTKEQTKTGAVYTIKDNFRSYPTLTAGIKDRNSFLQASRYKRVLDAKTADQQCMMLQACGYATDVLYGQKLINIINSPSYNLRQYDAKKKV